jgi:hypothetical protein
MKSSEEYAIPIVTNDDIRVIESYVSTGKDLPLTAEGVKKAINNAGDTVVAEVLKNYKIINAHALSWEKTQKSMITVGSVLISFSKDIHEYGDEAVDLITNMDGYKLRKIGDLTADELSAFPSISLDGGDQSKIATLEETIKYIKESINQKKQKSTVALADLDSFKKTLLDTIEPWIGKMIAISNPDALDREISDILRQLNKLKNDVVQAQVKPSFMQEVLGVAVYLSPLTALLNDSKKDGGPGEEFIKRRDKVLDELRNNNELKGVLHTLYIGMGSLYDVVTPTINAVMQLHSHWENILALIDDSLNQFKNKANYAYLGLFVRKLNILLRDWRSIEDNSSAVNEAFRLGKK